VLFDGCLAHPFWSFLLFRLSQVHVCEFRHSRIFSLRASQGICSGSLKGLFRQQEVPCLREGIGQKRRLCYSCAVALEMSDFKGPLEGTGCQKMSNRVEPGGNSIYSGCRDRPTIYLPQSGREFQRGNSPLLLSLSAAIDMGCLGILYYRHRGDFHHLARLFLSGSSGRECI